MRTYCIYCHTNKINGKKYIGQTHDYKKRCFPSNYKGCTKFYFAIQKYGWDSFEHTIIEDNLTLEQANEREEYYIKLYNTIEDGYNLKSGGLNNELSEESKQKISDKILTKKPIICIETQQIYPSALYIERQFGYANSNIIACCRGKLHTAYGYHWQYAENPVATTKDKRKKPVKCLETGRIYESASAAAKDMGINRSSISFCCEGKTNIGGGYHWQFIQEE